MGAITDFIDSAIDFVGDGLSSLADTIGDAIITAISNFVGMLLYYVTKALMSVVWLLQELFNVFSGTTKVQYDDEYDFLLNVFFQNQSVKNIYWAMALLGITFVIVFTMVAVIRKTFDLSDKHGNQSMGTILSTMFKSIFVMLIMNAALLASLTVTNLVINRIGYIFDNADSFSQKKEIHFTDEQYATMARIYKTIGNYSLNPSYTSRYNLNSCYNDIRQDLNYLESQDVFDLVYIAEKDGKEIDTWQSVLQELIYATDTSHELKMDVYYEEVSNSLLRIMKILQTNAEFFPISDYESGYTVANGVSLDRILFLSGTTGAAKNSKYNVNPYLTDGLRGAFYTGEKDIYKFDEVKSAFDIGLTGINYLFIWILTYFTIRNLLRCIFGCIMRIFNMVSLYIVAPLAVSTMPLDEGEKFKQWTMAMVIQAFGILGMIIPMRLIILFAPIILSPRLVLFESVSLNFLAKVLLIVGGLEAVEGFGQMVTGILANNTSYAALNAGNRAGQLGDQAFSMGKAATKAAAGGALSLGWGAAKLGAKAAVGAGAAALGAAGLVGSGIAAGAYHGAKGIGSGISSLRNYFSDHSIQSGSSGNPIGSSNGGQGIEMASLDSNGHTLGGAPNNFHGIGGNEKPMTGGLGTNSPLSGNPSLGNAKPNGGKGIEMTSLGSNGHTLGGAPNNFHGIGGNEKPMSGGLGTNAPLSGNPSPGNAKPNGGQGIEMASLGSNGHLPGGDSGQPFENMSGSYGSDNFVANHGDVDSFLNGTGNPSVEPMSGFDNGQGGFVGSAPSMENMNGSYGADSNMVSEYGSVDDFLSGKAPTVRPMESVSGSYGSDNFVANHGDVNSIPSGTSNPSVEPMSSFGNSQSGFVNNVPSGGPLPFEGTIGQNFTGAASSASVAPTQSVPKKAPPPRKRADAAIQYKPGYEGGKMKKVESGKDPLSQMNKKK